MRINAFARGAGLAIVFAAVMAFAFAAQTSECAANTTTTDVTIECGRGHEAFAAKLQDALNMDSNEELIVEFHDKFYILNTQASVSGTKVTVTCPDQSLHNGNTVTLGALRKGISQILTRMSGNSGNADVHGYSMDNGELLWNSEVSYYASYTYESITNYRGCDYYKAYLAYQKDVEYWADFAVNSNRIKELYLLWQKPYSRNVGVAIDTPLCGSTDGPSVTCETLPFLTYTAVVSTPIEEPVWISDKPDGVVLHHDVWSMYSYKGALKGGTPYYACAVFHAPWGYYFPESFNNVTVNGQPADDADVWVGMRENTYEYLYVGAEMTPEHVWDNNWTLTKAPTCSAEGIESRPCVQGCGASDTRPVAIDPEAHTWGDWKTVKKPTALNAGLEQRVCKGNADHVEKRPLPAAGVSGTLLAQMKASGKTKLNLTWNKINGAEGYDIFFAKCNTKESRTKLKRVKTIKGNATFAWAKSGLKKQTAYKAQVKAFAYKDGKKKYVKTSPAVHVFTSGGSSKYTNPKSVSVNKTAVSVKTGRTFQIKGKVVKLNTKKKLIPKPHGPVLRYCSSNKSVATVSSAGKITAKNAGKCTIYVLAVNGVRKSIAVTVK